MATDLKAKNSIKSVFYFRGRFDDYFRELQDEDNEIHSKIFGETYQAYVFFVYYGLLKGKRHAFDSEKDQSSDPQAKSPIGYRYEYATRGSEIFNYDTLRKIVLIFDESRGMSFKEKMEDAFKYDYPTNDVDNEEMISRSRYGDHTELLDQYALGGLDLFYKQVSSISTREGFVEFMQKQMKEFNELAERMRVMVD